jgi:small-conductance mechanosensitive channel
MLKILFITLLLLISLLNAAEIDKKLFEGNNTKAYLVKVQKDINESKKLKIKTADIIKQEEALLKKLQQLQIEKQNLPTFRTKLLKKGKVSQTQCFYTFNELVHLKQEINRLQKKQEKQQKKIFKLKKKIETSTDQNRDNLLIKQLKYAFYKTSQQKLEHLLAKYKKLYQKDTHLLIKNLSRVNFKTKNISKEYKKLDENIDKLENQLTIINLEKDHADILDKDKKLQPIIKNKEKLEKKVEKLSMTKLDTTICMALHMLQKKDEEKFFEILNNLDKLKKGLKKEELEKFRASKEILKEFAVHVYGSTTATIQSFNETIKDKADDIIEDIRKPLFVYQEKAFTITVLFKIFMILITGFFIARVYRNRIIKLTKKRLLANLGYYFLIFITILVSLKSIGLNFTSISLIAGALSIGVGFGLQTVVSNIAAGIILMMEHSIRIGDFIEISDKLFGIVHNMGLRSTTIRTEDNIDIVVPNSTFITSSFVNRTLDDKTRRIHVHFSVQYGTDIDEVNRVILEALENSDLEHLRVKKKQPSIGMDKLSNSRVDLKLIVWVHNDIYKKPNAPESGFLILIYKTLNKHSIKMNIPNPFTAVTS